MGCCDNSTLFNFPTGEIPTIEDYIVLPNGDTKVIFTDGKYFIVKKGDGITVADKGIDTNGDAFVKFSDNTVITIPKGLPGEDTLIVNINPQVANEDFYLYYDFDYRLVVIKANDAQLISCTLQNTNGVYTGTNSDIAKLVVSKTGPMPVLTLKITKV